MDIEAIIAKAAAAATAAAAKESAKDKKKVQVSVDSPLAKRAAAAEKSRMLLEASRAKEVKQGLDLVEELLRDISPNVLRAITREDADRLLNSGVRLVINFTKTDASGSIPSFTITRGSVKTDRTIHRNSIEQWAASEAMFLDRYRQQGGNPNISSHHELMLELIEVNKENNRLRMMLKIAGEKALQESRVDAPMVPGSTETVSQPPVPAGAVSDVAQPKSPENIAADSSAAS
jgi:pyruvate-formate lyase